MDDNAMQNVDVILLVGENACLSCPDIHDESATSVDTIVSVPPNSRNQEPISTSQQLDTKELTSPKPSTPSLKA